MAKQFHNTNFSDPYQESAFVTGLIYLPECVGEIMKMMPTNDVIQHENIRKVYETVCSLYQDGKEVNEMAVRFEMVRAGNKPALDKSTMSLKFDENTPMDVESIVVACEGLISMYRRQLTYHLTIQLNAKLEGSIGDEELARDVNGVYEALTLRGGRSLEKNSRQACDEALLDIEKAMLLKESGKTSGVPTGSAKLDRELGGWQEDDVVVVAARPGGLKSGTALDFAVAAAERGYPVGIISVEMDAKKLKARIISMETKIPYSDMRRGTITREQFTQIQTATEKIGKLPIYYYDDVGISNVALMEVVVTEWARKHGIKMIIIDYLQYMNTGKKSFGLREDLTEVSKSIKAINRRLKIPIIELVQLSRAVDSRGDMRPIMSDLKECGQIEQDASIIIGLFYPDNILRQGKDVTDELSSPPGQPFEEGAFCYYILKSRSGSHFRVNRFVDPATNRFSDTNIFKTDPQIAIQYASNRALDAVGNSFEKRVANVKIQESSEPPF